jgi:hypothetical protein
MWHVGKGGEGKALLAEWTASRMTPVWESASLLLDWETKSSGK